MTKKICQGIIFCCSVFIMLISIFSVFSVSTKASSYNTRDISAYFKRYKYSDYIAENSDEDIPSDTVELDIDQPLKQSDDVFIINNYKKKPGASLYMTDSSYIEWSVDVPREGLYQIFVEYYPAEGDGGQIERSILINDERPFLEAASLVFYRTWKNAEKTSKDLQGNEIRPEQIEAPQWMGQDCKDFSGLYNEAFKFNFKKGRNVIRFESVKEPMVIGGIKLYNPKDIPSYEELKTGFYKAGHRSADFTVRLQAENMSLKSDQSIYPESDRSSSAMEPYSVDLIKLNKISSSKFQMPGQWIRWDFEVKKAGLYKAVVRYKQSSINGAFSSRKILIDDNLPCRESANVRFCFKDGWQCNPLSTSKGEVIIFYLKPGNHTFEMQVTLGDMADFAVQIDDIIYNLNIIYRKIITITGTTPDVYRDYRFESLIPDVIKELKINGERLRSLSNQIEKEAGAKGSFLAAFDKLAFDLLAMAENPRRISTKLENFKSNLGALGSWLSEVTKQPLDLDWIEITGADKPVPKAEKGFFSDFIHQIKLFFSSFYMDYSIIGSTLETDSSSSIKVWLGSGESGGRDQSRIIKQMVDQYFTPGKNISVDFQLVATDTLLPATLAGTGPDVSLQVVNADPVNYAMRAAVITLTQFGDFKKISERFNENAMVPYTYRGEVYALPETFTYPMLFYRTDIFEELGLQVPQTWDDVYDLIVRLNSYSMQFGLPSDMNSFIMLLYQNNCELYKKDGVATALDQKKAVKVFEQWTQFYTSYNLLVQYDFSNRFRTGEMPIAIANFSQYNQLSVFAPEIKGLWEMVPVPGFLKEDGTINRSAASTGAACIIMGQTSHKNEAWEFLKWWTSAEMQLRYAKEMESIMGVAARYPSANREAFSQIAWSNKDYASLMEQWKFVKGVPEVPGSYITSRYINFAFKSVINSNEEPGQSILGYAKKINEEISRKRKEIIID